METEDTEVEKNYRPCTVVTLEEVDREAGGTEKRMGEDKSMRIKEDLRSSKGLSLFQS